MSRPEIGRLEKVAQCAVTDRRLDDVGAGRRQRAAQPPGGEALCGLDDGHSLCDAVAVQQPVGGMRQAAPHHADHETTERADDKERAPTPAIVGHERQGDEGHDGEAQHACGNGPGGVAAAVPCRGKLAEIGADGGDFTADAHTGQEPPGDEPPDVHARRRQQRPHREERDRNHQPHPPAEAVGDTAVEERTENIAEQTPRDRPRGDLRGNPELLRYHRHGEANGDDVEKGEEETETDDAQDRPWIGPDRDTVEPGQDRARFIRRVFARHQQLPTWCTHSDNAAPLPSRCRTRV